MVTTLEEMTTPETDPILNGTHVQPLSVKLSKPVLRRISAAMHQAAGARGMAALAAENARSLQAEADKLMQAWVSMAQMAFEQKDVKLPAGNFRLELDEENEKLLWHSGDVGADSS